MPLILRELRCKNDDCRKLFCYENIKIGLLVIDCPRCDFKNEFHFSYSKTQQNVDTLIEMIEKKGGEK